MNRWASRGAIQWVCRKSETSRAALVEVLEEDLNQFLMRADAKTLRDDDKLEEAMRRIVRQTARSEIGKKPEVTTVISRMK